jgi:hypothetical protein
MENTGMKYNTWSTLRLNQLGFFSSVIFQSRLPWETCGRTDGWTDGPDAEFKQFFGFVIYVDNNQIVIRDRCTDGASGHGGGIDSFHAAISKVRNQYEKKHDIESTENMKIKSTENPLIGRMCCHLGRESFIERVYGAVYISVLDV